MYVYVIFVVMNNSR